MISYLFFIILCISIIAYLQYKDNSFLATFGYVFNCNSQNQMIFTLMIIILLPFINSFFAGFLVYCLMDELKRDK